MPNTYGDMVSDIVNESRRSLSDVISNLILDAIAHYAPEQFFLNQSTQTFSISSSQDTYTSADADFIPRIMEFTSLRLTVSDSDKPTLDKFTWQQFEDLNYGNSTSQPTAYAYWDESIRFYPIPDAGYEVRFSGIVSEPSLSLSTDSNNWTIRGKGYELIKQRAKSLLYSEVLRDDANAGRAAGREKEALDVLRKRTSRAQSTSEIKPCL